MQSKTLTATVIVTGCGYFVDIYDMLLFNIVRVPSLAAMGLSGQALTDQGLTILNLQMAGMLIGGIVWGALADRIGRKSCLFASILLYSLATLLCGFVNDPMHYAVLRAICGFGLAGEVGVGVTLITEQLAPEKRGLGVGLFSFLGILGAVGAGLMTELFDWRTAYIVGGAAGLLLLFARATLLESGLHARIDRTARTTGRLRVIFRNPVLLKRYLAGILIGVPIYFVIAILWTLAPELAQAFGIAVPVKASAMIATGYFCMTLGGLACAWLSERLRSRKRAVLYAQLAGLALFSLFMALQPQSAIAYYVLASAIGFAMGYWVVMITLAAEQFGTNIRGIAATTIPNFVRAAVIPINLAFAAFKGSGLLLTVGLIALVCFALAILATRYLEETYGKDLDYSD